MIDRDAQPGHCLWLIDEAERPTVGLFVGQPEVARNIARWRGTARRRSECVRRRAAHRRKRGGAIGEADRRIRTRMDPACRSEEHTSELQSLMRISYAVFCLK